MDVPRSKFTSIHQHLRFTTDVVRFSHPRPDFPAMPSDGTLHYVEGNARKRQRISRTESRPTDSASESNFLPTKPATIMSRPDEQAPVAGGEPAPCAHETMLQKLQVDLTAMRDLITCKICQRFLYEPYSLSCGHTFCYTCLTQWMSAAQRKTCPDCRNRITVEPTPSYLIREMVLVFISRSELLAEGETAEEHHQEAREEAEAVALDKANTDPRSGGLFKGYFYRQHEKLYAIRDHEDNVDRCPNCHHEIEDGWCLACAQRVHSTTGETDESDFSDDSDSMLSEELDHDLEADDEDDDGTEGRPWFLDEYADDDGSSEGYERDEDRGPQFSPIDVQSGGEEDDSDSEGEINDPETDSFVVNDDHVEYEDDEGPSELPDQIAISSDSDNDSDQPVAMPARSRRIQRQITIDSDDDDEDDVGDDDEDNESAAPTFGDPHNQLNTLPDESDSDDDSDNSNGEDDDDDSDLEHDDDLDEHDDEVEDDEQEDFNSEGSVDIASGGLYFHPDSPGGDDHGGYDDAGSDSDGTAHW